MAKPTKYNPEYHVDWAWSLAKRGATNDEIAEAFGISTRTFIRWTKSYESFAQAVYEGKHIADSKVERSLYQRALGYYTEESEKVVEVDKDGNTKPVRVRTTKRHVPADTMAIMYWLNNRSRKTGEWSQRQEVSLSSDAGGKVTIFLPQQEVDEDE